MSGLLDNNNFNSGLVLSLDDIQPPPFQYIKVNCVLKFFGKLITFFKRGLSPLFMHGRVGPCPLFEKKLAMFCLIFAIETHKFEQFCANLAFLKKMSFRSRYTLEKKSWCLSEYLVQMPVVFHFESNLLLRIETSFEICWITLVKSS